MSVTPDYRHPETREEFIRWLSNIQSIFNHRKTLDELKAMTDDELKEIYRDINKIVLLT